jgi:uncharacterized protein (DUF433 family)
MAKFTPAPCIPDEGIEARIPGTPLSVLTLIEVRNRWNASPEDMCARLQLSLAQVYAALAYYHANQALFDAELTRRKSEAEQALQALLQQSEGHGKWEEIVGKWPGDETDEEIAAALERLS